ncbi:FcoT family thioesterase [Nocardia iowensis]|uniref:FcoT family thioesterase n=1 Tax=Nocardia iowensis TaxID=204891 RepID=A0ABX8RMF4_NOCIO|nr:FcoT family thioesterase [Nocardia iowensis]QXN90094.1 FcoT family thioesterase [Nocardia iowensis]
MTVQIPPYRATTDVTLLTHALRPYRANCRYLMSCEVTTPDDSEALVVAAGDFEIPESCYIDDTGHFNSVEFNICFNQLSYYMVAKVIQDELLEELNHWSLADYWRTQLTNMLICDFQSSFRQPMSGRNFSGEVRLLKISKRESKRLGVPLIFLDTECHFSDATGGNCSGAVKLAIVDTIAGQS